MPTVPRRFILPFVVSKSSALCSHGEQIEQNRIECLSIVLKEWAGLHEIDEMLPESVVHVSKFIKAKFSKTSPAGR